MKGGLIEKKPRINGVEWDKCSFIFKYS